MPSESEKEVGALISKAAPDVGGENPAPFASGQPFFSTQLGLARKRRV